MPLASNPLIQVTPGLMIWTIVCFLITLFVLKRFAFGPIQKTIDERRDRIRASLDEADRLAPVSDELREVVTAEAEVPELRELLRNPQLDPRARAAAIEDVFGGGEELVRNFLLLLADKGRTDSLDEIAREYERLVAE